MLISRLDDDSLDFPNPRFAHQEGLLAWGGDLSPKRILKAYRSGIFPWFNEASPPLWWSPDPRMVLFLDDIKISKSLKKSLKKFEIKFDTNFLHVIQLCKNSREESWISDELIEVFYSLHVKGLAHSVESYYDGELVGGLYGLYLGGVFCGESMFALRRDASKVALVALVEKLKSLGSDFIDAQVVTAHLKSMGAKEIKRDDFLDMLKLSLEKDDRRGRW